MKPTSILFAGLLLMFVACKNPKPDLSGLKDSKDTSMMDTSGDMSSMEMPDSAEMMKAWEAFMTPGDMHKWMAKWDGTWTGDISSYMDPEGEPMKSTATMTNKMIMNGLYQMSDYSGNMMGQPFKGHGILAYDNAKKEFVNTWIDNMGSGVIVMRGSLDTSTNTLSIKGTQTDPMTGKDAMIREEVRFIDDNTHSFTMWGEMGGKEIKFMDATFKRKM